MRGAAILLVALAGQDRAEERGRFKLSYFGREAGTETWRLEEFDDGQVGLFSRAEFKIEVGGKAQAFSFDTVLTMDKSLAPIRYAGQHQAGSEKRRSKLEWSKGLAVPDQKPPVKSAAAHLLDSHVHAHYIPLFRAWEGGRRRLKVFNPATNADVEAVLEPKGEAVLRGGERDVRVREVQVTMGPVTATVLVDSARRPLRITVPPVGGLAELEGYEGWELRPVAPRPEGVEESEVQVKSLAGALTRPRAGTTFPALLLLSNPDLPWRAGEGREGLLREIAFALSEAGVLVLRVDDRPDLAKARPSDLVADAAAAVAVLRARPDVASVSLAGLGEGGVTAALVAARDPAVRAVVLLGTPLRPVEEVLLADYERELRAQGTAEAPLRDILAKQRALLAGIKKSKGDTMTIDERRTFVAGLRERMALDVPAELKKAKARIEYFQAGKDAGDAALSGAEAVRFEEHFSKEGRVDPAFLKELAARLLK